uniref:Transforming growth factor beta n=1 Tax=Ancylostoma caninum TaxID=29170 RepID=Q58J23_ANCCA|nr:transforming growth factor beta [Ancylostoma caninum]
MNRALLVVCVSVVLTLSTPPVSASLALSPHELGMLQKGFLRRFGFPRVPNLSGPALPIPDHVWDIYEEASEDGEMDWIRHYYPKELFELNSGLLVSYNLSASVRNAAEEEVVRANLKIKLHQTKRPTRVSVYEVEQQHPEIRRLLDSKTIDVSDTSRPTQWVDLDVAPALRASRNDHDTVTLFIDHPDTTIYSSEPHSMSTLPLTRHQSLPLVVYSVMKEPSRVRRKRAAPTRRDRKKQRKQHHRHNATESGICRKKALYVDFEEIGWQEWILAPKSYEAGQCVGSCPHPLPAHLNATNHAIGQSLTNSLNPQVPPPCCVPTETTHLSILFLDVDNKIIIKNYPDMRVEACGCR